MPCTFFIKTILVVQLILLIHVECSLSNQMMEEIINEERSSKKGVVIPWWPRHHCHDFEVFTTISWWYNYHTYENVTDDNPWWCKCENGSPHGDPACFPDNPKDIVFIPQVRGVPGHGRHPNDTFPDVADRYDTVLAYNEPNQPDQADISPEDAAFHYVELVEKYKDKIMVSPATGHMDTDWMDAFMEACELLDCRIDYLATHQYTGSPDEIIGKLEAYSKRYGGRKIWLTEFAHAKEHDEDKIIEFIEGLLPKLESADFIWRYSWWYSRYYDEPPDDTQWFWIDPVNSLLKFEESKLTRVGEAYNKPWHLEKSKQ